MDNHNDDISMETVTANKSLYDVTAMKLKNLSVDMGINQSESA